MDILYVGMKYEYGKPERGLSFEHYNFFDSLHHLGHNILYFDFPTLLKKYGRDRMNRRLSEITAAEKPDLLFSILFEDEFEHNTFRDISSSGFTRTLNWFCDDHWRFESYSKSWAPCFNWVVTTSQSALNHYHAVGLHHVVKSQWACNPSIYQKKQLPLKYDVTFVGQPHGRRRDIIRYLREKGIRVDVWGTGWETGRISQDRMIRVFNQSRVNLNFANASFEKMTLLQRAATKVRNRFPAAVKPINWVMDMLDPPDPGLYHEGIPQIKGRNFEIPGCGGFLLTDLAENLEEYYQPGIEIACFEGITDLAEKIRYYLAHEDERAAVAKAGYQRTLKDHTYAQRFSEIFKVMFDRPMAQDVETNPARAGAVEEVQ